MRFLRSRIVAAAFAATVAIAAAALVGADAIDARNDLRTRAAAITGGDSVRGEAMFIQYGCGSCHGLKHVRQATGAVGPPLDGVAVRTVIAGRLDNSPANFQAWIRDPQRISPATAMPDLNVGQRDARDINAFLYTRAE